MKYRDMDYEEAKKYLSDAWTPAKPHYINVKDVQTML